MSIPKTLRSHFGSLPSVQQILALTEDDENNPLLVNLSNWQRPSKEDLQTAILHATNIQVELGWTDRVLDALYIPKITRLKSESVNEEKTQLPKVSSLRENKTHDVVEDINTKIPSPLKEALNQQKIVGKEEVKIDEETTKSRLDMKNKFTKFISDEESFLRAQPNLPNIFEDAKSEDPRLAYPTSLLVIEDLDELSSEILKFRPNSKLGTISQLLNHQEFIVIGFDQGGVLIFSHHEKLLQTIPILPHTGKVTALCLSASADLLLIAHENGVIRIWDMKQRKEVKLVDALLGHKILFAKFIEGSEHLKFIVADSKGSIHLVSLSKVLFSYSSESSIFLDTAGFDILFLEVLTPLKRAPHVADSVHLLSFATPLSVCVVGINELITLDILPKPSSALDESKPFFSWKFPKPLEDVPSKLSRHHRLFHSNPAYALAWGKELTVKVVAPVKKDKIAASQGKRLGIKNIMSHTFDDELIHVSWIENKIIVVITKAMVLYLFDPIRKEELESFSISSSSILFVSTCFDSVILTSTTSDKVSLLRKLKLRSWDERVEALSEKGFWRDALSLGLHFLRTREKIDESFSENSAQVVDRLLIVLLRYLVSFFARERVELDEVSQLATISIDFCTKVRRCDFLFSEILDRFQNADAENIFIECLEPFILHNRDLVINVSMIDSIVAYYQNLERLRELDRCFLHLDLGSLDYDKVSAICEKNNLHYSRIFISNRLKNDFITPVMRSLSAYEARPDSQQFDAPESDNDILLLMFYLKSCFSGVEFPLGNDITFQKKWKMQHELIKYIFLDGTSTLRSLIALDCESFFSALRYLFLNFPNRKDTTASQNSLKNSQEQFDTASDSILGTFSQVTNVFVSNAVQGLQSTFRTNSPSRSVSPIKFGALSTMRRSDSLRDSQEQVSTSLQVAVNVLTSLNRDVLLTIDEKSYLLEFLSEFLFDKRIEVDSDTFNLILEQLLSGSIQTSLKRSARLNKNVRQERILRLLEQSPSIENRDAFITKALSSQLYRVCDHVYKMDGDIVNQLRITFLDTSIRDVFDFVFQHLSDDSLSTRIKNELKYEVLDNFKLFVNLNHSASAKLASRFFSQDIEKLISGFEDSPETQFKFLRNLASLQGAGETSFSFNDDKNRKLHEKYILLLCRYSPNEVYNHLIGCENYDLKSIMQHCKELNIRDAYTFLLERTGDIPGALSLNLQNLSFLLSRAEKFKEIPEDCESDIMRLLKVTTELCERASLRKEKHCEKFWNQVLMSLVSSQLDLQKAPHKNIQFYELLIRVIRTFVASMSAHVSMDSILRSIFDSGSGLFYSQYKDVIDQILFSFSCDTAILTCARRCFVSDLYASTHDKICLQSSAVLVSTMECRVCDRPITLSRNHNASSLSSEAEDGISVFQCGHTFHSKCLGRKRCPICAQQNLTIGRSASPRSSLMSPRGIDFPK